MLVYYYSNHLAHRLEVNATGGDLASACIVYTVKIWVHSNLKLLIYLCTLLYLGYFHHVEQDLSDNPTDNTFHR